MFKRLQIENFQAHASFAVDLSSITVFVGDSDVGKSSILRALRWVCFNKPDGTNFIRQGESLCSVKLELWNGTTIERRRGKTVNEYLLNGSVLTAFGREVPSVVQDALRVSLVSFQSQHEMPFWLDVSKGMIAKNLNSVVDLEVMDRSLAYLSKGLKQKQQQLSHIEHDIVNTRAELFALYGLKKAKQEFEAIASLAETVQEQGDKINNLKKHVESIRKVKHLASLIPPDSTEMDRIRSATKANTRSIRNLSRLIESIQRLQKRIKQWDHDLSKMPVSTVCPTCGQKVRRS